MANPQTENGYTKIANEILDALCRIRISGEARQVLDVIIRKTYGFNKKEDRIALSQLCLGTGLKKQTICKAIAKLVEMNLLTKKGNDSGNSYRFNKDFDTWKPLPKKVTLPKKVKGITNKGNNRNPKSDIQKTIPKETITKEIADESAPNPKHKEFIDWYSKTCFSARNVKVKFNGAGVANLKRALKTESFEELQKRAVYYLGSIDFKTFSPGLETFLSAGVQNGIANKSKNDEKYWRDLERLVGKYIAPPIDRLATLKLQAAMVTKF